MRLSFPLVAGAVVLSSEDKIILKDSCNYFRFTKENSSLRCRDWSDFWECYIWATASEVLGREAATGGSKGRANWFNITECPRLLLHHRNSLHQTSALITPGFVSMLAQTRFICIRLGPFQPIRFRFVSTKTEPMPQKFPAPHKPSPRTFPATSRTSAPPAAAGARKLAQHTMPRKAKSIAKPASSPAAGAQYWLLKTEPGEWSWSDQTRAAGGTAPWDGVRNRQAMNYLRAMRPGDQCLFYHSGAGAASRRVVGVVEVARPWYEGEGEKAADGGAVDVRAVGEFRRPVALGEIKKAADEVEGMWDFALLRQPRLSVMPVPAKVWDWICQMGGGFVQDGEGEVEEEEKEG